MAKSGKLEVPVAFFVCAFENLLTNYGIDYEQPEKVPQVPPKDDSKSKKGREAACTFQSRIADLRLRRMLDQEPEIYANAHEKIEKGIEKYSNSIAGRPSANINDAFEAERAKRHDVPLYIRNSIKRERIWWKEKKQPRPLNMSQITKEYTGRLQQAESIGRNRAMNRRKKLEQHKLAGTQGLPKPRKTHKTSAYYVDENSNTGTNYYHRD